jgi:hypothetical protein
VRLRSFEGEVRWDGALEVWHEDVDRFGVLSGGTGSRSASPVMRHPRRRAFAEDRPTRVARIEGRVATPPQISIELAGASTV